ncbi:NADH-quinone oxidoreductase subunit NuoF [Acidaminobacter sp. JC074]|uniref:NADH-quinone oxidoreductase subunit NuoF n=1 Tax=Acidaminobacter sp. JC074 TaxID=2530199 RepID=UPI001F0FE0B8|nr:NADH-quinone oxidoreductase subunit NuoF [Acidaminobacter sp. JC074]MCH4891097.1 NADH-quinone oxidoreductase subunit NuoF [Acidaminobacter sp. JC074]
MKILVGSGSCGIAAGADRILNFLNTESWSMGLDVSIGITGCVGTCYLEPIVDVYDGPSMRRFVNVDESLAKEILEKVRDGKLDLKGSQEAMNQIEKQNRIVLRNCGLINPESYSDYIKTGGYQSIKKCLSVMTQEDVINEIKISGLGGRGGSGFPTWFKWNAARKSSGKVKYMVCNADEGDPGAFMDRSVLEGDPHSLIEGMMIAGYAIGAEKGIVYVRAEYPLAIKRLDLAIEQAKGKGILGKNIFGTSFSFDISIKAGAGAFVCGEETALIASLEGERGMPRLKPPFPAEKGYYDNPTNINNVETLANVPWIIQEGGHAFADLGSDNSNGTKVFALTGKIKKGGLVEVPMGMTLRDVIYDIGGGIVDDKPFKAVQLGGPSGGCVPEHLLDTPVEYQAIINTGAIVGSGGMVVMDESTCMVGMAKFFLEFTCKESCGKCTYCRIGTKRMLEVLERITEGKGKEGDIELLEELSYKIKDGSLCGLGQTAPNPVLTTLKYFRHEYEEHLAGKCRAGSCSALLSFTIEDNCVGCTVCARACPTNAIAGNLKEKHLIDQDKCIKCGQCVDKCKFKAISMK